MQPRSSDRAKFSEKREQHRHAYRDRLTADQKKFRILQLFKNGAPIKIGSILDMRISHKIEDLSVLLQEMSNNDWIGVPSYPVDQWEKKHECVILDKGKKIIKMLSIVKAISPDHPLFDFDIFSMSDMENEDGTLKDRFNAHFKIEPDTDQHILTEIRKLIKNHENKSINN